MISEPLKPAHWLVVLTHHYAEAFQLADHCAKKGLKNLEITALGSQGLLISEAPQALSAKELDELKSTFSQAIVQLNFLENLPAEAMKAYLSLDGANVEKSLLFLEFNFAGEALQAAAEALKAGLKIVDLKLVRAKSTVTHLILTHGDSQKAENFQKKYSSAFGRMILDPSPEVRKFFEIYPN